MTRPASPRRDSNVVGVRDGELIVTEGALSTEPLTAGKHSYMCKY